MVATAWLFLIVAGLFGPCWAISLKNSNGLRKFKWTAAMFGFMAMSVFLMSRALVSSPASSGCRGRRRRRPGDPYTFSRTADAIINKR